MTPVCVIMFEDESLGRIAPIEYVKLDNNRKFKPKSAKDLPDEKAFVKWQKSVNTGSFLSDGYFPAQILAIAGSVKSTLAKAAEMKVKMHPTPVLALPASTSSTESPSSKRKKAKDVPSESNSKADATTPNESGSEKTNGASLRVVQSKPIAKVSSAKHSRHGKKSGKKSQESSSSKDNGKSKPKKLKLDDVAINRVKDQLALAVIDNPLVITL